MKKLLIGVGVCGVLCLIGALFCALKSVCMPFILGFMLAYVLRPLTAKLSCKYSPTTAARLALFFLVCLFLLVLFVLIPIIQAQLFFLMEKAPVYINALVKKIEPVLSWLQDYFDKEQISAWQQELNGKGLVVVRELGSLILGLFSQGSVLVSISTALVITPIMTYYFLKGWDPMMKKIGDLIPRRWFATLAEMFKEIDTLLSAFLRGQCLVCLLLAVYYAIALTLIGLDLGLAVGILTGLFEFIPFLGVLTGFVFSLILAFAQASWTTAIWVVGVFLIGQILESYVLTPRLIGKRVGLSPAVVIFVVLAGGSLLGFWGVLLAIPGTIIIGVPLRMLIKAYRSSSWYKDKHEK